MGRRKAAFPVGRIAPIFCMDGTIPLIACRSSDRIASFQKSMGLVANVFMRGTPICIRSFSMMPMSDNWRGRGIWRDICGSASGRRVLTASMVWNRKRDLMPVIFTEAIWRSSTPPCAFDDRAANPGKCFQRSSLPELGRMHVRAGKLPFPEIPRF